MLAQSLPIISPAPKVHAKDLPGWRLLLEFSRNTVSTLPNYAFDALISRRRVLGFDSLLLSDPDGVRHVLTTAMDKYKRLVSTRRVPAPLGDNGHATAGPPSSAMNSRRFTLSMGDFLPDALRRRLARALSLPKSAAGRPGSPWGKPETF